MKIVKVKVGYSELRSGYNFSNRAFSIEYEAEVAEDELASIVRRDLMEKAIADVKALHGDPMGNKKVVIKFVETTEQDF